MADDWGDNNNGDNDPWAMGGGGWGGGPGWNGEPNAMPADPADSASEPPKVQNNVSFSKFELATTALYEVEYEDTLTFRRTYVLPPGDPNIRGLRKKNIPLSPKSKKRWVLDFTAQPDRTAIQDGTGDFSFFVFAQNQMPDEVTRKVTINAKITTIESDEVVGSFSCVDKTCTSSITVDLCKLHVLRAHPEVQQSQRVNLFFSLKEEIPFYQDLPETKSPTLDLEALTLSAASLLTIPRHQVNDVCFEFPKNDGVKRLFASSRLIRQTSEFFAAFFDSECKSEEEFSNDASSLLSKQAREASGDDSDMEDEVDASSEESHETIVHRIVISDFSYTTFRAFLWYLHTGNVVFAEGRGSVKRMSKGAAAPSETAEPQVASRRAKARKDAIKIDDKFPIFPVLSRSMYRIADKYNHAGLEEVTRAHLLSLVTPETAVATLCHPFTLLYKPLVTSATTYIIKHWEEVSSTRSFVMELGACLQGPASVELKEAWDKIFKEVSAEYKERAERVEQLTKENESNNRRSRGGFN